jgi:hypothetical protein
MAALARAHWKEVNPEVYQKMVDRNALGEESEAAAKLTQMEMNTLMLLKISEQEAWQQSRHLFIYVTKDQLEEMYHPEDEE